MLGHSERNDLTKKKGMARAGAFETQNKSAERERERERAVGEGEGGRGSNRSCGCVRTICWCEHFALVDKIAVNRLQDLQGQREAESTRRQSTKEPLCVCMFVHTHRHTHTRTHAHTHTHSLSLSCVCVECAKPHLCFDKVTDANFCHDRNGDGGLDLLDHLWVGHASNSTCSEQNERSKL